MTTMELNAQMLRDLAYIAEDERLMKRVAKYISNIVAKAKATAHDDTLMTKEEYLAMLSEAKAQAEKGEGITLHNAAQIDEWFAHL